MKGTQSEFHIESLVDNKRDLSPEVEIASGRTAMPSHQNAPVVTPVLTAPWVQTSKVEC